MCQQSKNLSQRGLRLPLRSLFLAASLILPASHAGETLLANSAFDANAAGWYWEDWATPGSSAAFDATQNAPVTGGAANSGSLKLVANFTAAEGYQQAVYTLPLPAPQDFNNQVGWLSFDVKVDAASTPRAETDYGVLEVILRQGNDWTWVGLPGVRLNGNEWQRISFQVPKTGVDSIRGITLKLGENALQGPVTLNIDNIAYSTTPDDVLITQVNNGIPDAAPEGWVWENWSATGVATFDPLDIPGRSTSGSVKLEHQFTESATTYQQSVFTFVIPGGQVDAAKEFSELNLDVRVAPGSIPRASGDYGYWQVILRNGAGWDWLDTSINGANGLRLTDNEWHRLSFKVPTTASAVHRLTFKTGDNGMLGPVTLNVDNISWTRNTTPPLPPSLSIDRAAGGLSLVTTSTDQYGRHNIYTTDNTLYSFAGSTEPVSYSFTIDKFPDQAAYPGFQAHIFLVPGNPSTASSPDWNEPTLMFIDIKAGANNTGNATFRSKIDQAGGNSQLYAAGLTTVNSATVLGTWTVTIDPVANTATMTAPDGTVSAPIDISALAPAFADGNLRIYFGAQANATANQGQSIHVAKAEVKKGSTVLLSDTFTGEALDPQWTVNASAGGVQFVPGSEANWILRWTLPDTGFTAQVASTLTNPNWTDIDLSANISTVGGTRQAIVPKAALPAGDTVFFRLVQPAPAP